MMREVNRSIVLDLIRTRGPLSRTDVARSTSLAKPTVSDIVEELLEAGLVMEVGAGETTPQGGRPPTLLSYNVDAAAYIGIDFGVHNTTVAVADGRGAVRGELVEPSTADDPAGAVAQVRRMAGALLDDVAVDWTRVHALSAVVAGVVDRETGDVVLAPNLRWRSFPLRASLTEAFGVVASVHNVTHAAAVAEGEVGVAAGVQDYAWVYVGTGVGAGLVVDGRLMTGPRGFAGELGHCPVADDGPRCNCGRRGCLETLASAPALVRAARTALDAGERTSLETVERVDAVTVVEAARAGDAVSRRIVADVGDALGRGVAYLCNILNPSLVVLGGPVAAAGDVLLEPLRASVAAHALDASQPDVVVTTLGDRAELIGSVLLAMGSAEQSHRIVSTGFRHAAPGG